MPWVKVAKISDIPVGQIRSFTVEGKAPLAIAHLENGFFAIDDTCTHAQCSLGEGMMAEHEVECHCHGSRFDVKTGAVRFLPATMPIKTYPIRVEGEDISLEL
ncbi:MAG: non-heme iron oxygenase ferredoxin subunit [Patescibacteria group bacterium]